MKWSQLKSRIRELLAESVCDRIDFGVTKYGRSEDASRGWITIDKVEVLNLSTIEFNYEWYGRHIGGRGDPKAIHKELNDRNVFALRDLSGSLFDYLNLSIEEIHKSDNPIIRAFGMLDARMGKRRLLKIDPSQEHDLVKKLYLLRCQAEELPLRKFENADGLKEPIEIPLLRKKVDPLAVKRKEAADRLASDHVMRNLKSLVHRIYRKELDKDKLKGDIPHILWKAFDDSSDTDFLQRTLLHVATKSDLLGEAEYLQAVVYSAKDSAHWIRPVETWKPSSHNRVKQFSSLLRHLWARYDIPLFMDRAWLMGNAAHQQWFKDLGAGRNIRSCDSLPIPLTKKMAHEFLLAPDGYTIEAAFRWAQVRALGGDKRLADALLDTRLVRDFRDDEFWLSVIRFFVYHPMLDPVHINPIIDYIWNQKYENRIVFVRPGVAEEAGPEQPNFCMRGRTIEALLRAVEAWHRKLGKETKAGNLQWTHSAVRDFSFIEGNEKSGNMKVWRIRELLNSQELIAEGRRMKHCVATYTKSCHDRKCSIWSMEMETAECTEKLLTIEVLSAAKEIRQVRGLRNRLAVEKELEVLRRWAGREGLILAP